MTLIETYRVLKRTVKSEESKLVLENEIRPLRKGESKQIQQFFRLYYVNLVVGILIGILIAQGLSDPYLYVIPIIVCPFLFNGMMLMIARKYICEIVEKQKTR